jgi:hypothetical protein
MYTSVVVCDHHFHNHFRITVSFTVREMTVFVDLCSNTESSANSQVESLQPSYNMPPVASSVSHAKQTM